MITRVLNGFHSQTPVSVCTNMHNIDYREITIKMIKGIRLLWIMLN